MAKGKTKIAAAVAAAAAAAAYFAIRSGGSGGPAALGARIVGDFDISRIARIEIGSNTVLAASDSGWVVESMQNYPADRAKISDALVKLQELKAGQIVRGRKLAEKIPVTGKDAKGGEVFGVVLGERHANWSFGRYAEYKGEAVLTGEALEQFDGPDTVWCDTKIIDEPWVSFTALAPKDAGDSVTGFSTGVVAKVTVAGDTNATATVGNKVKDGGRYLKLGGKDWIYIIPEYAAEKLLPKPPPPPEQKAEKPEPAKEPVKEASKSAGGKPTAAAAEEKKTAEAKPAAGNGK